MDKALFSDKVINYLFLGISEVTSQIPMGGKHWIELTTEKLVQRLFNEFKKDFTPASNRLADLCQAWINLMHKNGFVKESHYQYAEEADLVRIQTNCSECNYRDSCHQAWEEELPCVCHRLVAFKWVISHISGQPYQLNMEERPDKNWVMGVIAPAKPVLDVLARQGDRITVAGERAVVMSTKAFGYLLKAIRQYSPQVLRQLLYESSYNSSVAEYRQLEPYCTDKRELIEWLLYYISHLGVCRYELIEYDQARQRARVRCYDSYMANMFTDYSLSPSPQIACDTARGRLAAYFSLAWNEEMVCEELECEALGHDFCEFVILPRNL